jgi:hypothetical protein
MSKAKNMAPAQCRTYSGRFLIHAELPKDQRFRFYNELRQLWERALLEPQLKRAHKHIAIALEVLANTYSNDDMGSDP